MFGPSGVSIGAHAAVVTVVDVADLESGAVTGETAGAEGGETALVGQLGERVSLVHELGEGGVSRRTP